MSNFSLDPFTWWRSLNTFAKSLSTHNQLLAEQADLLQQVAQLQQELSNLRKPQEPEPTVPVLEPVADTMPPKPAAEALLKELLRLVVHWNTSDEDIAERQAEFLRYYPEQETEARKQIETAKKIKNGLNTLFHKGKGAETPKQETAARQYCEDFCQRYPTFKGQARDQLQKGLKARERNTETKQRRKTGVLTTVKPKQVSRQPVASPRLAPAKTATAPVPVATFHAQDIRGLATAANWTLLIDETGEYFGEAAQALSTQDRQLGRWVGLLMPNKAHGLTPLKSGWHAVNCGLDEIDQVVQRVLDAQVGVLGLTVQQVPLTSGERWATGVLSLIDWVLRLLPLQGPTTLKVQIENRDVFTRKMEWPALAADALRRLAIAYPERATRIKLDISIIDKWTSPYNGYVDALAFTWGSPADASQARLKASGLPGCCFLAGNSAEILQAWEWLDRGITIRPSDWSQLLIQPDAGIAGGLTATILQRLAESCRNNVTLWRSFAEETRNHLDSKAVNLRALGKQIDWLETCRPADTALTPRLRLLWLTARLAAANHLGAVEQDWMSEMQTLGTQLMDEDAPLVCWADLHLAVTATNRYDFAAAPACLQRWRDVPCSVPGLRYWAQACSSLGQHAAFVGDADQARTCFEAALSAFENLSDESARKKDCQQTATYLAIVETDHADAVESRAAVERVTGPLLAAIERLADQCSDRDKYIHHLVLRWLVRHGNAAERAAYLARQEDWQTGYGHPWPLIELYRGLLLYPTDTAAAIERALNAYDLAIEQNQGPTVQLIGAACRTIAASWGQAWPESETVLAKLEQQIPQARNALDAMRAYLTHPEQPPMAFLEQVLPFNFH